MDRMKARTSGGKTLSNSLTAPLIRPPLDCARDAFDKLSISAYGSDAVQAPQFWQRGSDIFAHTLSWNGT
jgi:hypothetical protein